MEVHTGPKQMKKCRDKVSRKASEYLAELVGGMGPRHLVALPIQLALRAPQLALDAPERGRRPLLLVPAGRVLARLLLRLRLRRRLVALRHLAIGIPIAGQVLRRARIVAHVVAMVTDGPAHRVVQVIARALLLLQRLKHIHYIIVLCLISLPF